MPTQIKPESIYALYDVRGTTFISRDRDFKVEIGDSTQRHFYPQVKLIRSPVIENEFNFSIRLNKDLQGYRVLQDQEKIVQTFPDGTVVRFYPLGDDYEFDIGLPSRPANDVVPFTCQTKGLVFYPQRTLTNVHADGSSWEVNGDIRSDRAAKVNESLAVYYDGKAHNAYKAGKAFHLYRPLAVDSRHRSFWCDWVLDGRNVPTGIRMPAHFAYPGWLDPTIGNSSQGGSQVVLPGSRIGAVGNVAAFTMPENGTAGDIQFYRHTERDIAYIPYDVTMGIYTNPAGVTTALVADTAGGDTGNSTGWKTQSISGSLTTGTAYRLAIAHNGGFDGSQNESYAYDDGSTADTLDFPLSTYVSGTLPNPFPAQTLGAFLVSVYINYTAGAGGPVTHNTRSHPLGVKLGYARRRPGRI